jgi:hypothetical protein
VGRKEDAMHFEPVLFDNPMFETASEALFLCREFLEKNEPRAALRLAGFEPVNTAAMGRVVLGVLYQIRATVRGEAREHVDVALNAVRRALAEPAFNPEGPSFSAVA